VEGVSLAAAVAVVRALHDAAVAGVGLKWPNDVLWGGRKLAGILLEVNGEATGAVNLVAGVGINLRMPKAVGATIDQPWTDLDQASGGATISRNRLAGLLLQHLVEVLAHFEAEGPAALIEEWSDYDETRGRRVELHTAQGVIRGVAAGVDAAGALLLAREGRTERYYSGEVSLRLGAGKGSA
jgi:BirA family biotin operon repressor/biotin-[acetyl-CoA-carboxylase] ligase